MEQRGVPTVVLVSEPFVPMAVAQAAALEYPEARLVTFEHPLAGRPEGDVEALADRLVDDIIDKLTQA